MGGYEIYKGEKERGRWGERAGRKGGREREGNVIEREKHA
jgi:hypothetical protein